MTPWSRHALTDPAALPSPERGAALWWLGQAGFLVRQGGATLVIDAYLSDSLAEKYRGARFPHTRMTPPPVAPVALAGVDWLLCTHAHTDHMDPGTVRALLAASPSARVLAPRAVRQAALDRGVPATRLVTIDAGETVDLGGVTVTATPAAHETFALTPDGHPFLGYVLAGGGVTLWHSGDTIPFPGLVGLVAPHRVDLALLPVNGRDAMRAANGVPGNLTLEEAVALTDAIGARGMLGHHFGLFDFNTLDAEDGARRLAALAPEASVALVEPATAYAVASAPRTTTAILAVCKGNICRSPLAEGLLRRELAGTGIAIDSAGIMDWNVGRSPDPRAIAVAHGHGLDISGQRARQLADADFDAFDLVLAMDAENAAALSERRPTGARARIVPLGELIEPGHTADIADPYDRGPEAFETAFADIERAIRTLVRPLAQPGRQQDSAREPRTVATRRPR